MKAASVVASQKLAISDITAGALCALVTLAYASSFASLIFGGRLTPFAHLGVLAALIGSCVALAVLSWRSSFFFSMGGPDSNPSAILAVSVAAIAADFAKKSGVPTAGLLPTVLMFLFVSAIGCGLLIYLVGERRWGRYVRYIPYPVVGGFLVGTGYLLLAGGWKMLTGAEFSDTTLSQIETVPRLAWTTAGIVTASLLLFTRTWRHFLTIPLVIFTAVIVFHVALRLDGVGIATARNQGLLLEPLHIGQWSNPFNQSWSIVRWDLILRHANDFAAMTMVVLITILLNATSLDHTLGQDADYDRELKALGLANVLSGLAGGIVAVNSFNRSLVNLRAGAQSRWAVRVCVFFVAIFVVGAPGAVGWLPKPVLTGLIIYLGLSLLLHWLWDVRREMPSGDYAIMLVILGAVMVSGIVAGVMVGILASIVSFVLNLSRTAVVKERFTCTNRRSNVERPAEDIEWLRMHGELVQGATLQGFLFFGTSITVLDQLRDSFRQARVLTLDFWHVRGIDASSVIVLRKLLRLAANAGVTVVFTGLSDRLRQRMSTCGLDLKQSTVRVFPDLDHGLEWAEESLLSDSKKATTLERVFGGFSPDEKSVTQRLFTTIHAPAGETFVRRGETANLLYIVLDGRVSIYLHVSGTAYRKRLRSYGAGTILGEMGFYNGEPRSADISADTEAHLACISREGLFELESEHPMLASRMHRLVVHALAARLQSANTTIADLL